MGLYLGRLNLTCAGPGKSLDIHLHTGLKKLWETPKTSKTFKTGFVEVWNSKVLQFLLKLELVNLYVNIYIYILF